MSNMETKKRYCKNKKCRCELPSDYKGKYCLNCTKKKAKFWRHVGEGVLTVAGVLITVVTFGKTKKF